MITVLPAFYDEFFCIAGECKHSCCMGWEIDIDDVTAAKYLKEKSPFGEKLRENIEFGETASFRLT
jgi:lysine-N-methylase